MKKTLTNIVTIACVMFGSYAWADEQQIAIKDHSYAPASIEVPVGTKVSWINHDQDPHTVVDSDKQPRFRSPALDTNEKYSYTFDKPGKYQYFCTLHPDMVGTVNVTQ